MSNSYTIKALIRRKKFDDSSIDNSKLARVLSIFDLTFLGVGSTLGLGVYVLVGEVASRNSGPAVCISFLIAAVTSVFSGLCYAEFGARVPRAGSAYVYSYVTVGELMAFIIGWNLVLEYIIGAASVARGYSAYIDSLFNSTIRKHFEEWLPINISGLSSFPDFIAFGLTAALTLLLAIGVKESIGLHTIMTGINLLVVLFIIIAGAFKIDFNNWNLSESEVGSGNGKGGFLPFGFSGMMSGAATCFYAFVGFDAIATTGEEAKNPKRAIPISIVCSLGLIFLAYFGISSVQTLIYPYYLQDDDNTHGAPLPYIFEHLGWVWAKWIITVGALNGLSTSLLGGMYPLPRILYAMASDGLIFRFLSKVHHRFKTPLFATLISGFLAAVMASLFNIAELADMMSIGTLLAYSLVAESILIIRYSNNESNDDIKSNDSSLEKHSIVEKRDFKSIFRLILNIDRLSKPNELSSKIANSMIIAISLLIVLFDGLLVYFEEELTDLRLGPLISVLTILCLIVITIIALSLQPTIEKSKLFEVPFIPAVPLLSVFVNVYLMFKLSTSTWIRFAVWMFLGFLIYGLYGIRQSSERHKENNERKSSVIAIQ